MKEENFLIDQGNSLTKVGISTSKGFIFLLETENIESIFEKKIKKPNIVWISSVAKEKDFAHLKKLIELKWGSTIKTVVISDYLDYLPTNYDYKQLGVDRWLAMLACKNHVNGSCLVIDAGTATTIDLLDTRGKHIGGLITPGLHLSKKAILNGTAIDIENNEIDAKINLGLNTQEAIDNGILMSSISLIQKIFESYREKLTICLGGGNSNILSQNLPIPNTVFKNLVLEGLHHLASHVNDKD